VVDFVRRWSEESEISAGRFLSWLGIGASKFYDWRQRYGRVNEHNGWIPRDFWLEAWEKEAIIQFHREHPLEGYRRLAFMMLDADVVAVSPASVWRVLRSAGLLSRWKAKPSRKGTGFEQPLVPHQHWHVDCFLHQPVGHVLLLVQRVGWIQSLPGALGAAGIDAGGGYRNHARRCEGKVPGSETTDHLRQRTAVHRARLQGVYSDFGYDACTNIAVVSTVEWETGALAPIVKK